MAKVSPDPRSAVAQDVATLEVTPRTDRDTRAEIRERLADLGRLEDGWMSGKGVAPSKAALDVVARVLDSELSTVAESVLICPTLEGGVQLEWSLEDRYAFEVEVFADAETTEGAVMDMNTMEAWDLEIDPGNASDWRKLARLIESHM